MDGGKTKSMKKRKWIVMELLLLFVLAGCGTKEVSKDLKQNPTEQAEIALETELNQEELQSASYLGDWNDTTFTNQWSNIQMTVSKSAAIFTREQFPLFVTMKDNQIWDVILMLDDWDSSIYIFYEKPEKEMDMDTFLRQKFEELEAPEGLSNQINGWADVVLGSETYRKMETSIRNDKFTDFYARKNGEYFIVIQVRSTPFKLEEMKGILKTMNGGNEKVVSNH